MYETSPGNYESRIRTAVQSFGDNTIADGFRHHIPTGAMNAGIKNRRYNEYQMFTSGDYKCDPMPSHLIPWSAGELP